MNMKKSSILKFVICLFTLNSISLFLYFSSHHHTDHNFFNRRLGILNQNIVPPKTPIAYNFTLRVPFVAHHSKPWPILPSYLPWSQNPNVSFRSCEAYFGNGFTRRIDIRNGSGGGDGGGWFRCYYSETLRSSICEGGRIRMNPEKINVSKGGERLEDVIGREENTELPEFEEGAFDVEGGVGKVKGGEKLVSREKLDEYVEEGAIMRHTMRDLIASIRVVDDHEFRCEQWVEEPVLLVTRFEYANLFHTVTDWYSAYVASRVTGLPNRPHLVFVDGHCKAPLEDTWRELFSSLRYAKNFSGPVCFRHAIFAPLGYETALFKGLSEDVNCYGASAGDLWQNPNDQKTARLSEFGEMVRAAFGFRVSRNRVKRTSSSLHILFVRREDYLAHPRHGGKVESRLSNEAEVYDVLNKWASNYLGCNVKLVNGLFAHMPMKAQIRAIQDASIIIGAHGAGLTHVISATAGTEILEIISSEYMRPHFQLIAKWKGLKYQAINLAGSYADPAVVLDKVGSIVRSLGC